MGQNKFEYVYSAPSVEERRAAEAIRRQYAPLSESDGRYERLKKLHFKVSKLPAIISLLWGIVGTLIFGGGLAILLIAGKPVALGLAVQAAGAVWAAAAYPIFLWQTKRQRRRHVYEILRLCAILSDDKNSQGR